jgi:hypothetical protein
VTFVREREREARCESVGKRQTCTEERHGIGARGKGASAKGKMRERKREAMRERSALCKRDAQCTWKLGVMYEREAPMNERVSEAEILFCG